MQTSFRENSLAVDYCISASSSNSTSLSSLQAIKLWTINSECNSVKQCVHLQHAALQDKLTIVAFTVRVIVSLCSKAFGSTYERPCVLWLYAMTVVCCMTKYPASCRLASFGSTECAACNVLGHCLQSCRQASMCLVSSAMLPWIVESDPPAGA